MANGHDSNKTPPPPPPPPTGPGTPGHVGTIKPDGTSVQPPQLRRVAAMGGAVGGFLGGLIGALIACCFCMNHHS